MLRVWRRSSAIGITVFLSAILLRAGVAQAALTLVNIYDNVTYAQTSTSAPTTPKGYFFSIGGNMQSPADFNFVNADYSANSVQNLPIQGSSFGYNSGFFSTLADLHTSFPFGAYAIKAFNLNTTAQQTGVVNYAADYFTADIPALSAASFNSLQGADPSTAVALSFNLFIPNSHVSLGDTFVTVFDSSVNNIYGSGALPNTARSFTIPANTLLPNTKYYVEIDFTDRLNGTDTVNHIPTLQGFDVRTDINFTTGAEVPEPGSITLAILICAPVLRSRRRQPDSTNSFGVKN